MNPPQKDFLWALGGFASAVVLTWLFIEAFDGYISDAQMGLSGTIAGGKWAVQLLLATTLLQEKKWRYFREMGLICAAGSGVLIPYIIFRGEWPFFLGSLISCVVVMALLVIWRLRTLMISSWWTVAWFALLAYAVTLQLTVVFRVFP